MTVQLFFSVDDYVGVLDENIGCTILECKDNMKEVCLLLSCFDSLKHTQPVFCVDKRKH